MDSTTNLEELLGHLEARNVVIRRVALGGEGGGLCKVRGKDVFFLDTEADTADTVAKCAEALVKLTNAE